MVKIIWCYIEKKSAKKGIVTPGWLNHLDVYAYLEVYPPECKESPMKITVSKSKYSTFMNSETETVSVVSCLWRWSLYSNVYWDYGPSIYIHHHKIHPFEFSCTHRVPKQSLSKERLVGDGKEKGYCSDNNNFSGPSSGLCLVGC